MSRTVVVHGHFYQPPRENPWTEEVPREPGAAPFHDWNSRIAAECYRPNAFARIVDERNRIVDIVNNYERISFDFGPTLTSWLDESAPETYERVRTGDAAGGGAIAQAFFHVILPLAGEREIRTQIRWGLADFRHRFGREAEGIWLPETAVDEAVMRIVAEEGIRFTILAPRQAARVRLLDGAEDWADVSEQTLDTSRCYRWLHPDNPDLGVDIAFYDGSLSHAIAFELPGLSSEGLIDRVEAAAPADGFVVLAADGETFGHHHKFGDRLLAYAVAVEAPKRGIRVATVADVVSHHRPTHEVEVRLSAWSCAHGVGRWAEDCGCATEHRPGWTQAWRAPLRSALELLAAAIDEVFERRGAEAFHDAWSARDGYVEVLIGATSIDDFCGQHVRGDRVQALTLLEAQRHRMAMFTSCGWFFNDLAGLEAVQVLRYAARAIDCLYEIGETPPVDEFLRLLAEAQSNVEEEGNGRDVWECHVVPARVDAERVVAHLALAELLDRRQPASRLAAFDVDVIDQDHFDRGGAALNLGRLALTHRRTGRRTEHVYATLHLGGLEVLGATRPPNAADGAAFAALAGAFEAGASITRLLRLLGEGFGPHEFDLTSALPDAGEGLVQTTSAALAERFGAAFDRLYTDHRSTIVALNAAGVELPRELRAVTAIALGRRLETEVARHGGSLDPADHERARATAREARDAGVSLDTPGARATFENLLLAVAARAGSDEAAAAEACAALALAHQLGLELALDGVQEVVWKALRENPSPGPSLSRLATALGLAPA